MYISVGRSVESAGRFCFVSRPVVTVRLILQVVCVLVGDIVVLWQNA